MLGVDGPDIVIDTAPLDSLLAGLPDLQYDFPLPRPRPVIRTLGVIGLDAMVTAFVVVTCFCLFHPIRELSTGSVTIPMACLTLCMNLCFFERGLYAEPEINSRSVNWRKIALAWLQTVAAGALIVYLLDSVADSVRGLPPGMAGSLRGRWLPTLLIAGIAAISGGRIFFARAYTASVPLNRTVIIGERDQTQDLIQRIRAGRRRGFDIVGIFEHGEDLSKAAGPLDNRSLLGLPFLGGLDALECMIRKDAVEAVLVALPWSAGDRAGAIIQRLSMAPVDIYIYPPAIVFARPLQRAASVHELPLLRACARPINGRGAFIKRAEDVVFSLAILVLVFPVMLTIAALVKLTSEGPILFRQRRLGYNNRVIEVLKFRSMYAHLSDADARQQTLSGDKRVTRIGGWLRKTSLDELPQLLNVLKGEMSLVGPRPHALATTAGGLALQDAVPVYYSRHRVKPGITGWAQVNGYRGALDSVDKIVHRVNHDLFYIENWSLTLDLKILWLTIGLIFVDDRAF